MSKQVIKLLSVSESIVRAQAPGQPVVEIDWNTLRRAASQSDRRLAGFYSDLHKRAQSKHRQQVDARRKAILRRIGAHIEVHTAGQSFACAGRIVRNTTGQVITETQEFPFGMTGPAYNAAMALVDYLA